MYMDGIFAENDKELKTLIESMRIFSDDIGIVFGIEKCPLQKMKSV